MKKIFPLAFVLMLLNSLTLYSQDFRVPAGQLKVKEDYAAYEKDIIAAQKWLLATPFNEQPERRQQVYQFILDWVNGSPTVFCEIPDFVVDVHKKNFGMMFIWMGGVSRYVLENNYTTEIIPKYKAALQDMLVVYKSDQGIKKDKKMEKLIKAIDEGKLDEWMKEHLMLKR